MTKRDEAYEDYLAGIEYKDIAKKYGVKPATVMSWARRYWNKKAAAAGKVLKPKAKGHGKNKGGAPYGNRNAVKHGIFAKYLPAETLELVMELDKASPLDILFANIKLKFAAILRAQRLLYVADANDHTQLAKTETKVVMDPTFGQRREIVKSVEQITALQKETAFLNAQSRAMGTLTTMIRQYEEMCSVLGKEEQLARISKLKTEVAVMNSREQLIKDSAEGVQIVDDIGQT